MRTGVRGSPTGLVALLVSAVVGALASSSRPLSKVQVVNPVQRGARCLDGR